MTRIAPTDHESKCSRTFSYLRESTADQDTDKFRNEVLNYCNTNNLGQVKFFKDKVSGTTSWRKHKVADILESAKKGDRLIVPELSRLGRSTAEILEILNIAKKRKLRSIR